jgi:hypothetical protein
VRFLAGHQHVIMLIFFILTRSYANNLLIIAIVKVRSIDIDNEHQQQQQEQHDNAKMKEK